MADAQADWQSRIEAVGQATAQAIREADSLEALRLIEVRALGRQGEISLLMREIPSIAPAERKAFGQAVNRVQKEAEQAVALRKEQLVQALIDAELADDTFDVTLPAIARTRGHVHPVSLVQERVESVFTSMGFHVLDYPEVESEFNNFEALNIPSWHPARDMQDTFWLGDGHLLRTHTSSGQVRAIAITSSKRSPLEPDLPTVSESGLKGFELVTWYAVITRAGTPKAIVDQIARDIAAVVKEPKMAANLATEGTQVVASTPDEFTPYLAAEVKKWAAIVKQANIQPE